MTKQVTGHSAVLTRYRRHRAVIAAMFLLLFVFSYSEDMVSGVLEATGRDRHVGWIVGLDLASSVASTPDQPSRDPPPLR